MEKTFDSALSARRETGFRVASCVALLMAVISWMNRPIVKVLNAHVFHAAGMDTSGWWLYVVLRLPLAAFFVWTVVRFPADSGRADSLTSEIRQSRFFDPLMGLRALACFFVLTGHYFLALSFNFSAYHGYEVMLLSSSPWSGVWLFFALSGFLMGKAFARGRYTLDEAGCRLFLRNRLLRIAPVYYCGLLIVSLYRYPEILRPRNWWMLIEMFIFDYRGDLPMNPIGALWSVSTEVQFYLLVPVLMLGLLHVRRRTGRAFVVAPAALLALGAVFRIWLAAHSPNMYMYGYAPLLPNLDLFLAGMSVNLLPALKNISPAARQRLGPVLFVSSLGFYILICAFTQYRDMTLDNFWAKGPWLCGALAVALIYLAETRGRIPIRRGWLGRFLIGLQATGTLTYCLYVFHPEVFTVNGMLVPEPRTLAVSLIHLPLVALETVVVASFFYFAVEKPFDIKKRVSGTPLTDAP